MPLAAPTLAAHASANQHRPCGNALAKLKKQSIFNMLHAGSAGE
jgi:hypothetical protein